MKKILYSIIAGLVLASCGSMKPTANNSAATAAPAPAPAPAQTTTSAPSASASQVESSVKDAINSAVATNNSASFLAGSQSGVALKALYNQYKLDGKLDLSNLSNVANILNVAAQAQQIKNAEKGTVNYTDFSKGLVEGATGLISDINADAVVDGLKQAVSSKVDTEKVNEVSDKAQTAATNISQTATSIMEVIKLFQK
jgi:hypothetical protein